MHRFNKSQQDALLPHVENGTLTFVGATTENPYFEVNKALVSRSRIFVLEPLSEEDIARVIANGAANGAMRASSRRVTDQYARRVGSTSVRHRSTPPSRFSTRS